MSGTDGADVPRTYDWEEDGEREEPIDTTAGAEEGNETNGSTMCTGLGGAEMTG